MENENKKYQTICGETIYHSRSVAVCVHIYARIAGEIYVAVLQRGANMDHGSMWCMPCGYLDWNETAEQGARREVREELGIESEALGELEFILADDSPSAYRQNITFAYRANLTELKVLNSCGAADGEVQNTRWMNVNEVKNREHIWAFDHDQKILTDLKIS